jgi:hypothetical protein
VPRGTIRTGDLLVSESRSRPAFPVRLVNLLAKLPYTGWCASVPTPQSVSTTLGTLWAHKRGKLHEDTVDELLDRLGNVREELVGIERSLERMKAAKLEQGKDKSGKQ